MAKGKHPQRRKGSRNRPKPVINPSAAGIDVGAREIYVAVPVDRDPEAVRTFHTFTPDLIQLAEWLASCEVTTVAMEATSVYWMPLFTILEERGIEVCLVNARHLRRVPGRKTDVLDCEWLQYLHSVGLLRGSFHPPEAVAAVRTVLRHKASLVQMASSHVQHMHKALTQMNLQIHHVISDITGVTGMRILDAILDGERRPEALADLRDPRIKADQKTLAKALTGTWRREHLFTLRQSLTAYRHYQTQIEQCHAELHQLLGTFGSRIDPDDNPLPPPPPGRRKDPLGFDLRTELYRIFGVDLTAIPGVDVNTVYTLFAECGRDLSAFPTAGDFASWLGLCPDNRITGGKVLSTRTRKVIHPLATALRLAAQALHRSQSTLGDFYRRMRYRLGPAKAMTAVAHKLARIIHYLVTTGQAYDETVLAQNHHRTLARKTHRLKLQAAALGFNLVPTQVS
jgi:transposase